MRIVPVIKGVMTYVPTAYRYLAKGTGGTDSARYCYSVWLRHLVLAGESGLNTNPQVVAELGPGDSLGIGLAALISGCDKYFAFDVVEYANIERNLKVFDELITLFKKKEQIPGEAEFPYIKPRLGAYGFPKDIFDDRRLVLALDNARLEKIRSSIINISNENSVIKYKAPWFDASVMERESVDMIFSQAVLEHVDELANTYEAMHFWLKPNGYMSHQIDFKCHGVANTWNGHWAYTDFMWKLVRGKRPYFLNREPHSTHIAMLREGNFRIVCDQTIKSNSNLKRNDLAAKYKHISDDDLTTSSAFIQAVR